MHFLTIFVDWLFAASARASLLTAAVFIIQSLLRYRVPARWRYAMWIPVLVVLLVPSFPESKWSVHSIVQLLQAPLAVSVTIEPSRVLGVNAVGVADFRMAVFSSWQQMIPLAWLIGAAGIALFHIGAFVQTLRLFKRSQVPASDALLEEVAALARDLDLCQTPRVCMAREIRTPAVTGLLHPMLLLPVNIQEILSVRELQFVLGHELTHIKRGDLPLNALLCVLLSLHWFKAPIQVARRNVPEHLGKEIELLLPPMLQALGWTSPACSLRKAARLQSRLFEEDGVARGFPCFSQRM